MKKQIQLFFFFIVVLLFSGTSFGQTQNAKINVASASMQQLAANTTLVRAELRGEKSAFGSSMPNMYRGDNCIPIPNGYRGDNCVPIPNVYQGQPMAFNPSDSLRDNLLEKRFFERQERKQDRPTPKEPGVRQ